MLCGYRERIEPYVHQKVNVWHKRGVVYQLEVNGRIVHELEQSNKKFIWATYFISYVMLLYSLLFYQYFFSILRP